MEARVLQQTLELPHLPNCDERPAIFVNKKNDKEEEKEKYFGDYLTKYPGPAGTLIDRKAMAMEFWVR